MYFFICLVLLFICEFAPTYSKDDVNDYIFKRIGVARCRANCISEFYQQTGQFRDGSNLECSPTANWKCGMCWDYCDMLIEEEQTRNQMCNDNICLDGCKLACKFYSNRQNTKEQPRSSKILDIKLSSSLLSWNYKMGKNSNLKTVFVAFGLKHNGKWEEIDQVAEQKISLESENQKLLAVTIFAVQSGEILTYATTNITRGELPLHENINFRAFDKSLENKVPDLNQQHSSSYLEQWAICLIVSCVLVFLIIIFLCLYFNFLNNKLFRNVRSKQSVSRSLSANSEFYIDVDHTITHSTRL